VGFRSPATHRNADWMSELGCLYDTSFLDTAPFEPQPGGCCSIEPYFLDDIVELPMTLTMDHTLWEILRDTSPDRWISKTQWLMANHGLVNLLVHPDYVTSPERLAGYDAFLGFLAAQPGAWHALPEQVARWWRARAALTPDSLNGEAIDVGGAQVRPTLAHAREDQGLIVFEPADSRT
jgi:hypothetical protein